MRMNTQVKLAATFIALEALDAGLTLWATNNGFQEGNPLLEPFAHTWAQPVVKVALALAVAWVLCRAWKSLKTRRMASISFMAVIGIQAVVLGMWGMALSV